MFKCKSKNCNGTLEKAIWNDLNNKQKQAVFKKKLEYRKQKKKVIVKSYYKCSDCGRIKVDWIGVTSVNNGKEESNFPSIIDFFKQRVFLSNKS